MSIKPPSGGQTDPSQQKTRRRSTSPLSRPSFFVVLVHNDPVTPRRFVVEVLKKFFQKPENEAAKIMALVRNFGTGVVGKYTHEIAETKAHRVNEYAREAGFPLFFSVEPE
jgi:ATP-dependent Clp protease adaptor protein ClpS